MTQSMRQKTYWCMKKFQFETTLATEDRKKKRINFLIYKCAMCLCGTFRNSKRDGQRDLSETSREIAQLYVPGLRDEPGAPCCEDENYQLARYQPQKLGWGRDLKIF